MERSRSQVLKSKSEALNSEEAPRLLTKQHDSRANSHKKRFAAWAWECSSIAAMLINCQNSHRCHHSQRNVKATNGSSVRQHSTLHFLHSWHGNQSIRHQPGRRHSKSRARARPIIEARRTRPDPIIAPYIISDKGRGHEVRLFGYFPEGLLRLRNEQTCSKRATACRNTQTCISISWQIGSLLWDRGSAMRCTLQPVLWLYSHTFTALALLDAW